MTRPADLSGWLLEASGNRRPRQMAVSGLATRGQPMTELGLQACSHQVLPRPPSRQ